MVLLLRLSPYDRGSSSPSTPGAGHSNTLFLSVFSLITMRTLKTPTVFFIGLLSFCDFMSDREKQDKTFGLCAEKGACARSFSAAQISSMQCVVGPVQVISSSQRRILMEEGTGRRFDKVVTL